MFAMAGMAGSIETADGFIYVNLAGLWFLGYLALVFVYYFAFEGALGSSPGKLALGLKVVDAHGGRPTISAIAIRNLVRFFDFLPAFYVVGFISVLATGVNRQRVGDIAAKTKVVRA